MCQPHNETLFKKHKKHAVRTPTTRILAYPGRVAIIVHSYAIQIQGPFTVAAGTRACLGFYIVSVRLSCLMIARLDSCYKQRDPELSEWPLDFLHLDYVCKLVIM